MMAGVWCWVKSGGTLLSSGPVNQKPSICLAKVLHSRWPAR